MEFIDIKREIEEERRTLDSKMKTTNIHNVEGSTLIKYRNTNNNNLAQTNANNTESSIKLLKIKTC